MALLKNIGYLATCLDKGGQGQVHPITDAAIAWEGGEIVWVGKEKDIPEQYVTGQIHDAGGHMVIPGLVDCHTHLAFGGWRSEEFEERLKGKSYLDIAKEGGGILSTVRETRKAGEEELYQKSSDLLDRMVKLGVAAVECKSGYGLSVGEELKILNIYDRLSKEHAVHIVPTFMGAHTVPPEFEDDREGYIRLITEEMIPAVANKGLAEFCDIFVEESAFTVEEAREILVTGQAAGLAPKIHADQLTSCGGAELAAEVEAASADHLEKITDKGIEAMAEAGVTAVTLPLASLYTRQQPLNCRRLVEAGIKVAVATDFNPGSAPSYNLPLAMMLACNQGGLTPNEALKGATIYAARAIHRDRKMGSIEEGKEACFAVIEASDPAFWMYHFSDNRCLKTFIAGKVI